MVRLQVTQPALEQNEDVRAQFQIRIAENYLPGQLVFVDESACNRTTTKRQCAWSPIGTRARRRDYFVRGKRRVHTLEPLEINSLTTIHLGQIFNASRIIT